MMKRICLFSLTCLAFAQPSEDALSRMRYRYIGPVGNRVDAAVGVPHDPNIYYAGAASGGIFKSTDGGHALGTHLRQATSLFGRRASCVRMYLQAGHS